MLPCFGGGFCLLFGFNAHLHEIHTFLQSGVCRLLHSGQCVNLWAFGSYSGVLPQVSCFILFSVVTVSIIRIFIEFLVVYVVCVLVCPFVQMTLVCSHACGMGGRAWVTMSSSLVVSLHLLQVCPFLWGPPICLFSVSGAEASPPLVASGPLGSSSTTPLLPPTLFPPVSSGFTCPTLVPPKGSRHSRA